ncbi:hypothetical protein L7F22_000958 [Adiantum nelumboides]|nr:hypothetical protein [Adiantum nelumboides]
MPSRVKEGALPVHDALKQVVLKKDNEIENLNLQLTRIKNMEFSSNLDVVEGILNDDVVLDDLYDIGAFTNSIKEIGSSPFSKEVQFLDNILEDLYSLCVQVPDVNVKQTATAADIAQVFVKEIVKLHGIPARIISDRDAKFTSKFWQAMFQSLGTQLNLSTAYHPETYGQTERVNQGLHHPSLMFMKVLHVDEAEASMYEVKASLFETSKGVGQPPSTLGDDDIQDEEVD